VTPDAVTAPPRRVPLPTGPDKTRRVREMFDTIAPRYELVNVLMTMGLDARWRTQTVAALGLAPGAIVLDVAAGTGDLCEVARRQGHQPIALDLSFGMLQAKSTSAPAVQCDASVLPVASGVADGVVCGFALRNFSDLAEALAEMSRVLRPGGRLALLEVGAPSGRLMKAGFGLWFNHVVPAIGAAISDRAAYQYLPASVAYLPPPEVLRDLLREVGFSGVNRRLLSGGLSQLYVATRAGAPR
jgi:demethylmenaquinone methyltransferase / 2-methoxy-6-polyprenyl-1,4-benzoquinol methylase